MKILLVQYNKSHKFFFWVNCRQQVMGNDLQSISPVAAEINQTIADLASDAPGSSVPTLPQETYVLNGLYV